MTDVVPEQRPVDLDELVDDQPAGSDGRDVVDEQLIARLAGRPRPMLCAIDGMCGVYY